MRVILIVFLVFSGADLYAQFPFFHYFQDSLLPGDRISGSFDSIDHRISEFQSTLPTRWRPSTDLFELENLPGIQVKPSATRFSAIAQVGLQYSLGSNNTQRAQISYTQALTDSSFIQMDYIRRSGSGVIRNSGYEANYLDIQYLLLRKHYATSVKILFDGSDRSLSGGTVGDTTDPAYTLIFSDVETPTASVFRRELRLKWDNYVSFTADSLLKTGVFLSPEFTIRNSRFTDFDTVPGSFNYNNDTTNDRWERSEVAATGGYFFHSRYFSVNGGFRVNYWDFDNLGRHSDTLETAITGNLLLSLRKNLGLTADIYYNLTGAFGQKSVNAKAFFDGSALDANVSLSFSQMFPDNYQRQLYGNRYNYSWTNKQLITVTKLSASVKYSNRIAPVFASFGVSNYGNFPFFVDSAWRQDTLSSLSFTYFSLRTDLRLRKLFIQPSVRVQLSGFDYMPSVQAFARVGYEGGLFRAKKLKAAIGVEAGYISAYKLLDYQPFMDTYIVPDNGSAMFSAMPKLHVFGQFELGFLRWFIRVENIEQQLMSRQNYEALGYPVPPMQFRLGVSWDIFN